MANQLWFRDLEGIFSPCFGLIGLIPFKDTRTHTRHVNIPETESCLCLLFPSEILLILCGMGKDVLWVIVVLR